MQPQPLHHCKWAHSRLKYMSTFWTERHSRKERNMKQKSISGTVAAADIESHQGWGGPKGMLAPTWRALSAGLLVCLFVSLLVWHTLVVVVAIPVPVVVLGLGVGRGDPVWDFGMAGSKNSRAPQGWWHSHVEKEMKKTDTLSLRKQTHIHTDTQTDTNVSIPLPVIVLQQWKSEWVSALRVGDHCCQCWDIQVMDGWVEFSLLNRNPAVLFYCLHPSISCKCLFIHSSLSLSLPVSIVGHVGDGGLVPPHVLCCVVLGIPCKLSVISGMTVNVPTTIHVQMGFYHIRTSGLSRL